MLKKILLLIVLTFSICSAQESKMASKRSTLIPIDSLRLARVRHSSIVLPNGNILVSGGSGLGVEKSCEIFDLQTQKWRLTGSLNKKREYHKMFLLKNNKVIAVGGYNNMSCEIFDIETETWTNADSLIAFRYLWTAALQLKNGDILVTGGSRHINSQPFYMGINDCEIYKQDTGRWEAIAPLHQARHRHTITELNDGKVIVTGGVDVGFGLDRNQLASCEIYDPVLNTWTTVSPLNIPRNSHASFLLPNGNVFVAGGHNQKSCEVYNSETNSWLITDSLLRGRSDCDIYWISSLSNLIFFGGEGNITWEAYDPINGKTLFWELGLNNKFYDHNSVQMSDEKIMIVGGEDINYPSIQQSNKCYIFTFDGLTAVEKTDEMPKDFCLFQNYPNPFNPGTKIKFSVPNTSKISLTVYDMLGRVITKLIDNEEKNIGVYEAYFNATGLSSGVYFYQLMVGNKIAVNKMLLTK